MGAERWSQIEALFRSARDCSPAERASLLAECDPEIRGEVELLLAQRSGGDSAEDTVTQLGPGSMLGPYQIKAVLGAGGMGDVFLAVDTRLGRQVALKISRDRFSDRFQREARAISALNHPHICTLYDVGPNYLVMELVEGETLAARLKKGALPHDLTLRYGAQIAEALAEAHAKGIVHRDLKPANIMIAKAGVKVLDFGLAKSEQDATLTSTNVVMGTPAYMAPEQAEGGRTDARTDIHALGLVLREMAAGKRGAGAALDPPHFAHVVERCLAHDPADRWQSANDVKAELDWAGKAQPTVAARSRPWRWLAAAAVLIAALSVGVTWLLTRERGTAPEAFHLQLGTPEGSRVLLGLPTGGIALAPDGKTAAYVLEQAGKSQLWLASLDGVNTRPVPESEGAAYPFWSPDGRSIAFFAAGKLLRSDLDVATPVQICECDGFGGAWMDDGRTIIYGGDGLMQVPASGGVPVPLVKLDASREETRMWWPQALPGGRFLYHLASARASILASGRAGIAGVYIASIEHASERRKLELAADTNALYARGNDARDYLLWLRGAVLTAQEIDLVRMQLAGSAKAVADGVGSISIIGLASVAASANGTVLFGAEPTTSQLTWMDRAGRPVGTVDEPASYLNFRISPSGTTVAAARDDVKGGVDLYLLDAGRNAATRFTTIGGLNWFPVWSPDGRTIAFTRTPGPALSKPVAAGEEHEVAPGLPHDWSADGRFLLYYASGEGSSRDLWYVQVTPDGQPAGDPQPYLQGPSSEWYGRFSPGSPARWVAYESDLTGRFEVYIDSFPQPRGARRISTAGGQYAQWNRNGRELFYLSAEGKLMAVDLIFSGDSVEASQPHELFPVPPPPNRLSLPYDTAPDGERFLVRVPTSDSPVLHVIVNWPALSRTR